MGVVRQDVNRSAGRSGIMGSSSVASHAASWMQFFIDGGSGIWASGWLGLMAATCGSVRETEAGDGTRGREPAPRGRFLALNPFRPLVFKHWHKRLTPPTSFSSRVAICSMKVAKCKSFLKEQA